MEPRRGGRGSIRGRAPARAEHRGVLRDRLGPRRDGKATGLGIPKNPLQLAVLAGAHQGEAYITAFPWPPIPVQKALFGVLSLLAPLARLLGYKERYPEYSGPEPPLGK